MTEISAINKSFSRGKGLPESKKPPPGHTNRKSERRQQLWIKKQKQARRLPGKQAMYTMTETSPQSDLPLPDDEEGTSDVIPDEVPRKDGPGGENSRKNRAE